MLRKHAETCSIAGHREDEAQDHVGGVIGIDGTACGNEQGHEYSFLVSCALLVISCSASSSASDSKSLHPWNSQPNTPAQPSTDSNMFSLACYIHSYRT